MYTVYVKNNHTGQKYVVKRRYSDFYKLRRELIEFVSWGHCADCHVFAECISSYPFPRRRVFRSNQAGVIQERVDSLEMFIRYILHCVTSGTFSNCSQADQNIRKCVLNSFLQIDADEVFKDIPPPRTESIGTDVSVAVALASPRDSAESVQKEIEETTAVIPSEEVDPDTCHICLQNWTECYCSDEDDAVHRYNSHKATSTPNSD